MSATGRSPRKSLPCDTERTDAANSRVSTDAGPCVQRPPLDYMLKRHTQVATAFQPPRIRRLRRAANRNRSCTGPGGEEAVMRCSSSRPHCSTSSCLAGHRLSWEITANTSIGSMSCNNLMCACDGSCAVLTGEVGVLGVVATPGRLAAALVLADLFSKGPDRLVRLRRRHSPCCVGCPGHVQSRGRTRGRGGTS